MDNSQDIDKRRHSPRLPRIVLKFSWRNKIVTEMFCG